MADPTRRIEAWKVKTTPERTKQVLEARQVAMQARYEAVMTQLCAMETQVKTVLNAAGVHTSLYVPYLNFGRQLWKLTRQQEISGQSFAMAAQVLLDKWHARGLDSEILAAIRTDVFDISAPKL
jgi:trimethylamine:corrinoid methyltransferase-like protein